MPWRDGAVCERGHVVNSYVRPSEPADPFCDRCGAQSITHCPSCSAPVRGQFYSRDPYVLVSNRYDPPNHCSQCGKAMPWTQRALDAIAEIAREGSALNDADTETLIEAVEALSVEGEESPDTVLAASRFKRIVAKAGGSAGKNIEQIAVQLITAAAKAQLGL